MGLLICLGILSGAAYIGHRIITEPCQSCEAQEALEQREEARLRVWRRYERNYERAQDRYNEAFERKFHIGRFR